MRLRQLVIAAESLDTADTLKTVLGLGSPFPDSGVNVFGIVNAVFALGDQFLEVIVPTTDTAPARRFLDRSGEGGYMVLFDTDDIVATRARVDKVGIRRVFEIDTDEIAATHLHPADMGAAIVSVDQPVPAGEWCWGGPDWKKNSVPACLTGAVLESPEPDRLASRWGEVLGVAPVKSASSFTMPLEVGTLEFAPGETDRLIAFTMKLPNCQAALARARNHGLDTDANGFSIAGVRFELSDA